MPSLHAQKQESLKCYPASVRETEARCSTDHCVSNTWRPVTMAKVARGSTNTNGSKMPIRHFPDSFLPLLSPIILNVRRYTIHSQ